MSDDFNQELEELLPEFSDGQSDEKPETETEETTEVEEEEVSTEEVQSAGEEEETETGGNLGVETEEEVSADPEPEPEKDPEPMVDPVVLQLQEQNAKLMQMLETIQQQNLPKNQTEEQQTQEEAVQIPENMEQLLAETDLDEVFSDRGKFIDLMEQVAFLAREQAVQRVATTLPQYVIAQVKQTEFLKKATDKFYGDHQALVPFKKAVGIVTNEVVEEHPDWDLPKVLDEVADRSYKLLNIQRQMEEKSAETTNQAPTKPSTTPAFNKATSGRRNTPKKMSKLQREIADLL